jgi:hypothetical protein
MSLAADKAELKAFVDENHYVDVGEGTKARPIAINHLVEDDGYSFVSILVTQMKTGHQAEVLVLAVPGTTEEDIRKNLGSIQPFH